MSVGLVIVSHSRKIAEGVVELAAQMAPDAATFIPSVIAVAWTSKAPRKMPGKASTLLIWLG